MNMKKIIATNLIIASTLGAVLMTPSLAKAELIYKDAPYIQPEAEWKKNVDIDYILRGEWRYIQKAYLGTRYLTDEEIESYMQQVYDNPAEADRRQAEYERFQHGNLDVQLYRYDRRIGYIVNNKTEERLVDEEARQAAAQSTPAPTQEVEDTSNSTNSNSSSNASSTTETNNTKVTESETSEPETETPEETSESIEESTDLSEEATEETSEETSPKKKKSKNPVIYVVDSVGDFFVTIGNSVAHFFGGIGRAVTSIF
ncbi:hypothetical protein [Lachnospira pectinoschiza]|uniref:Uncharacterized protein n=1 Tax=Lachnospira pectinoschiza TaxID=28052 RepID=A0A1G9WHL4_9FIRM|nr:hypothetical protein [Lachnospira pectinoschiza]SDM83753.1 hypothetical protein SAMN05216544_1206 [Lachnospira pectinoschiza]